MEIRMSLNPLVQLPSSSHCGGTRGGAVIRRSPFSTDSRTSSQKPWRQRQGLLVVHAKAKKGMASRPRQYNQRTAPPLAKLEDDGNPKFVIFIRMANVNIWYPLNIVTGGSTAKIIVAAKDTFVGKYIYKDTLARNLGAVIYRDEKEMQKMAMKQFRVLRSASEFKYGYKLVENNNLRGALATNDVIELPSRDELKTVVDKVKDFFGDARESFGKMTFLNSETESSAKEPTENTQKKSA